MGSVGREGSIASGIQLVVKALDWVLTRSSGEVPVLLENGAGQGNLVGGDVDQIAEIIAGCAHQDRLGVCLDTAHAVAHGYPICTEHGISGFLSHCDAVFGLTRLRLVHANDSKTAPGSRSDRHEHIGRGHIGTAGFRAILSEPRLQHLPFIMETHDQENWHRKDMTALRRCVALDARPPLPPRRAIPNWLLRT